VGDPGPPGQLGKGRPGRLDGPHERGLRRFPLGGEARRGTHGSIEEVALAEPQPGPDVDDAPLALGGQLADGDRRIATVRRQAQLVDGRQRDLRCAAPRR
jgi:hypothetical protein